MSGVDVYREKVLDHDRNPRNKHWLENADIESHGSNSTCGDDVLIQVKLHGDVMAEVAFTGYGCAISQAAASILTDVAKGKSLDWVKESSDEEVFKSLGLGEHKKTRAPCELLGIRALKNGVAKYRSSRPVAPT